jgi:hypothetical protein
VRAIISRPVEAGTPSRNDACLADQCEKWRAPRTNRLTQRTIRAREQYKAAVAAISMRRIYILGEPSHYERRSTLPIVKDRAPSQPLDTTYAARVVWR